MADNVQDDDWDGVAVKQGPDPEKRLGELKAKAPVKRKKARPFAKVYLDDAARLFGAMNCQKATVWVWLVHRAWKRQSQTISVPNGELTKFGVNREAKRQALQQLESVGAISINRRARKTPLVTLLCRQEPVEGIVGDPWNRCQETVHTVSLLLLFFSYSSLILLLFFSYSSLILLFFFSYSSLFFSYSSLILLLFFSYSSLILLLFFSYSSLLLLFSFSSSFSSLFFSYSSLILLIMS